MKTAILLLLISALLGVTTSAATVSFSGIPSTNVVNASDLLLLDSHLGGTNYSTRTLTVSNLSNVIAGTNTSNWSAVGTTNSSLAGVASAGGFGAGGITLTNWPWYPTNNTLTLAPNYGGSSAFPSFWTNGWFKIGPSSQYHLQEKFIDNRIVSVNSDRDTAFYVESTDTNTDHGDLQTTFFVARALHDTGDYAFVQTLSIDANNDGNGDSDFIQSLFLSPVQNGSGTTSDLNGLEIAAGATGGHVQRYSAIHIDSFVGPSRLGDNYGILIQDISGATNVNYAIKSGLGAVSFGDTVSTSSSYTSGAPSGGTAAAWKLGSYRTNYVEAEVGGTPVNLSLTVTPLAVSYATSVTVNFAANKLLTTILAGNETLTASNQSDGRSIDYEFYNGQSTNVNVILPSTWRIQSGAVTNILAPNASATLSMRYYAFITNTVALWASE